MEAETNQSKLYLGPHAPVQSFNADLCQKIPASTFSFRHGVGSEESKDVGVILPLSASWCWEAVPLCQSLRSRGSG